jgi:hypothetical protein
MSELERTANAHSVVRRPKTSVDIMNERDTYRARVRELEDALTKVRRETELALRFSDIHFLTLCRISCIARRAVGERDDETVTVAVSDSDCAAE